MTGSASWTPSGSPWLASSWGTLRFRLGWVKLLLLLGGGKRLYPGFSSTGHFSAISDGLLVDVLHGHIGPLLDHTVQLYGRELGRWDDDAVCPAIFRRPKHQACCCRERRLIPLDQGTCTQINGYQFGTWKFNMSLAYHWGILNLYFYLQDRLYFRQDSLCNYTRQDCQFVKRTTRN